MADEHRYFAHKKCEFFPCHEGADPDNFNCLFCYCPLYMLGKNCGGNFHIRADGVKDCTACLYPHLKENYDSVNSRFGDILAAMNK